MPVAPSGPISQPLENLRVLLADCPSFRAWVGAADAAEALNRIWLVDAPRPEEEGESYGPDELRAMRPFAVVDEFDRDDGGPGGDAWVSQRVALGAFVESGKLLLRFEADVPPEDAEDPAAARLGVMNAVGAVLQDVRGLGTGDNAYLSIHRITRHHGWRRSDEGAVGTQGDHFSVSFRIDYGI